MEITDFERVAASLTVRSIYSELGPDVPAGSDIGTAFEIMTEIDADPMNAPARVIASDSSTLGMVWYEELDADAGNVNEVMERLTPSDFLPADTTILDAFDLFCSKENTYFYLLEKNEVIGVLFFSDLFKPLGRLAFLALALEIEQLALKLCQLHGVSERCWATLSNNRRKQALKLYKTRFGHSAKKSSGKYKPIRELIGCTYLSDKATMIWNCKLIPATTRREVLGFFKTLEKVRNLCAHPNEEQSLVEALPRERLHDFIIAAREMRTSLSTSIQEQFLASLDEFLS